MLERGEADLAVALPAEINAATRNHHTTLNRLITSRLPLALPPNASDPTLYTTGLLHFAHIFLTFESLWADLLADPSSPPTSPILSYLLVNPYDSPSFFTPTLGTPTAPSPQLVAFLQKLRPRGLIRSPRLKRDLEHLMQVHPTDLDVLLAKYPGEKVAAFCTHIRNTVHAKPWTLVSYAWCFYMAVFSGGRWIRAGLLNAGPEFWQANEEKTDHNLVERGLSFWHFPGTFDGEDIKAEFKARLACAETLFTPDERVDIIEEAKNIFQLCATLVEELDGMVAAEFAKTKAEEDVKEQPIETMDEKLLLQDLAQSLHGKRVTPLVKPKEPVLRFIRKSQVTGTIVALACLVCVALFRFQ